MKLLFEIIMCLFLDGAVLALALTVIKAEIAERKSYRLVSGSFAIGFLCGIFAQILNGGNLIVMILFALGFMLAYTAFVFTFSEKRKHNEIR